MKGNRLQMKILEYMTITEAAMEIKSRAQTIMNEKKMTDKEAFNFIFQNADENLGGLNETRIRGESS